VKRGEDPVVDSKIRVTHVRAFDGIGHPQRDSTEVLGLEHGFSLSGNGPEHSAHEIGDAHGDGAPKCNPKCAGEHGRAAKTRGSPAEKR
jgi:hypothetical protein